MAALVGLGAWLWKPLTLAYAIHRVEGTAEYLPIRRGMGIPVADRWLVYCMEAARSGNRRAMELVIKHAGVKTPPSYRGSVTAPLEGPDVAFLAAADQPRLFFETLDRCDDQKVLAVLGALLDVSGEAFGIKRVASPGEAARELEALLKDQDVAVRGVARSALDFARRRYARELAEAAKTAARELSDDELVAIARKHVKDSVARNGEGAKFLQEHGARSILDPGKSGNGVEVTTALAPPLACREVTFFHNGWPYDGPRLEVKVRVKPDGSLVSIRTRAIPALGP